MVLPKAGATTFQLNGTVYLCFGHSRDEDCRDVYRFDPKEFRFIPLNSLLPDKYPGITRSYASSFVLTVDGQEYAYIVGGDLGLSVAPPYWYCCRYNYLKDEWEETPSMPRSRSCPLSPLTCRQRPIPRVQESHNPHLPPAPRRSARRHGKRPQDPWRSWQPIYKKRITNLLVIPLLGIFSKCPPKNIMAYDRV